MRVESAVTSVSWIPSEAVGGLTRMGFTAGAVRAHGVDHAAADHQRTSGAVTAAG